MPVAPETPDVTSARAALREAVRAFAQTTVRELAVETDRDHRFPREAIRQAATLDLMGILIPEAFGGAGLDHFAFAIAIEEIAAACASTAVIIDVHNSVACEPILLFGTEKQKLRWLPPMASGAVLGAFALSEPASGSDAGSLQTSARRDGDSWVLNGTKTFITNLGEAGLYIVFARTGDQAGSRGVSAFLVPADTPGVGPGQVFRKLGLHGSVTGELVLKDARVPADSMLHLENQGFAIAMRALDSGRIGISAQALGIARAALEDAIRFTKERQQFGRPVSDFQGVQFMLADMATRVEAARGLTYHAASLCTQGRPVTREAAMTKVFTTDTAMAVATDALQLAGGYGYITDYPFERYFRDAKATQIYEGTNQVQRIVIARELLR